MTGTATRRSSTDVIVHADAGLLAPAVAARLVVRILDAQSTRGTASVVLTGGRVAAAVHTAVATSPGCDAVDWSRVDLWWGDERFLPAGDPERNETQARAAVLDTLPLDPARIHPMPASDGPDGDDPDAAARRYAQTLREHGGPAGGLPRFDVLMLGVGEEGHVASVFPGSPAVTDAGPVTAVRDSPKPPPTRISLTLPAIATADEVWLVATGSGKSEAVAAALTGADPGQVPAAGVHGVRRTLWMLDRAAAASLPADAVSR